MPRLPDGTTLTVGTHRVTVNAFLSAGGFSHIYRVTMDPPEDGTATGCLKQVIVPDKSGLATLRKEVEVMKTLRRARCVVRYFDSHAERLADGTYQVLVLMELCPNKSLLEYMNARLREKLSEREILAIMRDIALAVYEMHRLQLVHRDIKIENVLIDGHGQFKLCDFGSVAPPTPVPADPAARAHLAHDILYQTTPQYRSPEMVDLYRGVAIDQCSDMWALGCFLYKLCYYTTPFEAQGDLAILHAAYVFPPVPPYSGDLKNLVVIMLQENAAMRPNIVQLLMLLARMMRLDFASLDVEDFYHAGEYDFQALHEMQRRALERQALERARAMERQALEKGRGRSQGSERSKSREARGSQEEHGVKQPSGERTAQSSERVQSGGRVSQSGERPVQSGEGVAIEERSDGLSKPDSHDSAADSLPSSEVNIGNAPDVSDFIKPPSQGDNVAAVGPDDDVFDGTAANADGKVESESDDDLALTVEDVEVRYPSLDALDVPGESGKDTIVDVPGVKASVYENVEAWQQAPASLDKDAERLAEAIFVSRTGSTKSRAVSEKSDTEQVVPVSTDKHESWEKDPSQVTGDYPQGPSEHTQVPTDYSQVSSDYSQVTKDYSQRPNDYSIRPSDYSRKSSDFSHKQSDHSQKPLEYPQGPSSYSQMASNYSQKPSDFLKPKDPPGISSEFERDDRGRLNEPTLSLSPEEQFFHQRSRSAYRASTNKRESSNPWGNMLGASVSSVPDLSKQMFSMNLEAEKNLIDLAHEPSPSVVPVAQYEEVSLLDLNMEPALRSEKEAREPQERLVPDIEAKVHMRPEIREVKPEAKSRSEQIREQVRDQIKAEALKPDILRPDGHPEVFKSEPIRKELRPDAKVGRTSRSEEPPLPLRPEAKARARSKEKSKENKDKEKPVFKKKVDIQAQPLAFQEEVIDFASDDENTNSEMSRVAIRDSLRRPKGRRSGDQRRSDSNHDSKKRRSFFSSD